MRFGRAAMWWRFRAAALRTINVWPAAAFALGLVIMAYAVNRSGKATLQQTAMVLFLAWCGVMLSSVVTKRNDAWFAFAIIDFVSGYFVLTHDGARRFPHSFIGVVFMVQLVVHLVYGVAFGGGDKAVRDFYLNLLAVGGWLQIGTLILGAIYGTGGKVHRALDWLGGVNCPRAASGARMEKGR